MMTRQTKAWGVVRDIDRSSVLGALGFRPIRVFMAWSLGFKVQVFFRLRHVSRV